MWNTMTNDGEWLQRGNNIHGEEDYDFSGHSVALSDVGDVVEVHKRMHPWDIQNAVP